MVLGHILNFIYDSFWAVDFQIFRLGYHNVNFFNRILPDNSTDIMANRRFSERVPSVSYVRKSGAFKSSLELLSVSVAYNRPCDNGRILPILVSQFWIFRKLQRQDPNNTILTNIVTENIEQPLDKIKNTVDKLIARYSSSDGG